MREAVLSGATVPSLVSEVKREEDVVAGHPNWTRYGQFQPDNPCKVSRDYFAAGETDLDWSGFAAGLWLSISTSND